MKGSAVTFVTSDAYQDYLSGGVLRKILEDGAMESIAEMEPPPEADGHGPIYDMKIIRFNYNEGEGCLYQHIEGKRDRLP